MVKKELETTEKAIERQRLIDDTETAHVRASLSTATATLITRSVITTLSEPLPDLPASATWTGVERTRTLDGARKEIRAQLRGPGCPDELVHSRAY